MTAARNEAGFPQGKPASRVYLCIGDIGGPNPPSCRSRPETSRNLIRYPYELHAVPGVIQALSEVSDPAGIAPHQKGHRK
jgi:hypothetical protein